MPWNDGNSFAWKHGFYSQAFSAEELAAREQFEREAIEEQGGELPAGKKALLRVTSLQIMMLNRAAHAIEQGIYIPQEHLIALMNSLRLNLSALGLEQKTKSEPAIARIWKAKQ
jgi:hypothetical protein